MNATHATAPVLTISALRRNPARLPYFRPVGRMTLDLPAEQAPVFLRQRVGPARACAGYEHRAFPVVPGKHARDNARIVPGP